MTDKSSKLFGYRLGDTYKFFGCLGRVVYMSRSQELPALGKDAYKGSLIAGTESQLHARGFRIVKDYPRGGLFV